MRARGEYLPEPVAPSPSRTNGFQLKQIMNNERKNAAHHVASTVHELLAVEHEISLPPDLALLPALHQISRHKGACRVCKPGRCTWRCARARSRRKGTPCSRARVLALTARQSVHPLSATCAPRCDRNGNWHSRSFRAGRRRKTEQLFPRLFDRRTPFRRLDRSGGLQIIRPRRSHEPKSVMMPSKRDGCACVYVGEVEQAMELVLGARRVVRDVRAPKDEPPTTPRLWSSLALFPEISRAQVGLVLSCACARKPARASRTPLAPQLLSLSILLFRC